MKKCLLFVSCVLILLVSTVSRAASLSSAVGYWNTVDDKTGKVLSIVKIYKEKDGSLSGKIEHIYAVAGQHAKDKCAACDGAQKNAPILGLRIISGMSKDSAVKWTGGRALDPKSGKIYRARMTLIDNGCKLDLRGYIGIPWIGRTETWLRTKSKQCPSD